MKKWQTILLWALPFGLIAWLLYKLLIAPRLATAKSGNAGSDAGGGAGALARAAQAFGLPPRGIIVRRSTPPPQPAPSSQSGTSILNSLLNALSQAFNKYLNSPSTPASQRGDFSSPGSPTPGLGTRANEFGIFTRDTGEDQSIDPMIANSPLYNPSASDLQLVSDFSGQQNLPPVGSTDTNTFIPSENPDNSIFPGPSPTGGNVNDNLVFPFDDPNSFGTPNPFANATGPILPYGTIGTTPSAGAGSPSGGNSNGSGIFFPGGFDPFTTPVDNNSNPIDSNSGGGSYIDPGSFGGDPEEE